MIGPILGAVFSWSSLQALRRRVAQLALVWVLRASGERSFQRRPGRKQMSRLEASSDGCVEIVCVPGGFKPNHGWLTFDVRVMSVQI